jgi:PhnB protein
MSKSVKPIPEGRQSVTAYICVKGAARAVEFYESVFGAVESGVRITDGEDKVGHTEITIGNTVIMMADEHPEIGVVSPETLGNSPVMLTVAVDDVDAVTKLAVAKGAKLLREPEDQFYGERSGQIEDPFGYRWSIQTHIEDVSEDELRRRAQELYS